MNTPSRPRHLEKALEPFALAIGEMCNEWAFLEQWIRRLFLFIGEWDYRLAATQDMVNRLDIRDLLAAIKIGAIIRCGNGPFLEALIASIDYLDNDLRGARNRFVHDCWAPSSSRMRVMRIDTSPKAIKVPSGGRSIESISISEVDIDELREVIDDIKAERDHLGEFIMFLQPKLFQAPQLKPPPRLHLLRQMEKQRQKGIGGAKQKPRRRSSPASQSEK
jgi:hypothetical protein